MIAQNGKQIPYDSLVTTRKLPLFYKSDYAIKGCAICWIFVKITNFIAQNSQLTFADLADIL